VTASRPRAALSLQALDAAARNVYAVMPPTPQYAWPLLARRAGREVWVKHENHTPTGAFKVRGGLNLLAGIAASGSACSGIASATRGNHGQSLAFAARMHGVRCVIVVPHGNSADKNAAMRAFGAELIEHGRDFDEARERAAVIAREQALRFVGPFEPELVAGVGTYAVELFRAVADIDCVYVPIGCGSGICGLIGARDALGLATRIVGVVSANANAYAQSFAAGRPIATGSADTLADGMAVRVPVEAALCGEDLRAKAWNSRMASGAKATTMIVSFSATWLKVKCGSPSTRFDQTKTMAVQGAAASRISPAM